MRTLFVMAWVGILTASVPYAQSEGDLDIVPKWTLEEVSSVLEKSRGTRMFPSVEDRAAWVAVGERLGDDWVAELTITAVSETQKELPTLPASLFLDFHRTGTRVNYEREWRKLSRGLGGLVLAECLETEGRFLDTLLNRAWRLCEASSWELPAHTEDLPHPGVHRIDLGVVHVAQELAFLVHTLGERLHPVLVERIRYEVDRRVFEPYLDEDVRFNWQTGTSNWNAVCCGGVICAALGLEEGLDAERLARIVTRAQNHILHSLHGFGRDGGTSEGILYWGYGFGNFVQASAALERRTGGRLSLLEGEHVRNVSLFPVRTELSPGAYPSFSDAAPYYRLPYWQAYWLAERLRLPALARTAWDQEVRNCPQPSNLLNTLLSVSLGPPVAPSEVRVTPASTFLRGIEWLVARAQPENRDGFMLGAKAGNNAEHHNHNDVGGYVVHWKGESLLVDPGAPIYTRDFFGPKRYGFFAAASRGHSVPLVNGLEQRRGRDAAAKILERTSSNESDRFVMDIVAAYPPKAGLASLVRSFELERNGAGRLTLTDRVEWKQEKGSFQEVLITFADVEKPSPGRLRIQGEKGAIEVAYEPRDASVEIETFETSEFQLRVPNPQVRRIAIEVEGERPEVRLVITPVE